MRRRGHAHAERIAWVLALGLHAGVGLLVTKGRPPASPTLVTDAAATELEIVVFPTATDNTTDDTEAPAPARSTTRAKTATKSSTAVAEERSTKAAPDDSRPRDADASTYSLDPRAPASSEEPRRRAISFVLPPGSVGTEREAGPDPTKPKEEPGDGLRRSLLRESADHDRKLGLGLGSQVVLAAEPAVREAGAPDGWAILDVLLDGEGHTRGVTLQQSDVAGFAGAVTAVRNALSKRVLKIPPTYKGARVRIKIVSRIRLPNGQEKLVEMVQPFKSDDEPGKDKPETTTPKHSRWWEDLDPKRDLHLLRPTPVAPPGSHFDPSGITLPLFRFDPANIGAKKVFTVGITVMDVVPE